LVEHGYANAAATILRCMESTLAWSCFRSSITASASPTTFPSSSRRPPLSASSSPTSDMLYPEAQLRRRFYRARSLTTPRPASVRRRPRLRPPFWFLTVSLRLYVAPRRHPMLGHPLLGS
jgi:hypothetical protein